jgi:serine/threonine protein phosphatase PrpC/CRP-like cAMP-binding protein
VGLAETISFHASTDVGRQREHNEDNFLIDKKLHLAVVADGMGGHAAGEVASAIAVRILHQEVRKRAAFLAEYAKKGSGMRGGAREIHAILAAAVRLACQKIHEEGKADSERRGMGTTLSALLVVGSHGFVAHVGDSRIYLLRNSRIQQITEDHTVFNELVKRGRLTLEQIEKVAQKNAITRAVGVYETVEVDTLTLEVLPGDVFLLASDGLHGYINHSVELEPYLDGDDGDGAVRELVDLANRKGGKDNITCVMVRLGAGDARDERRARRVEQKREVLANMPLFAKLGERELLRVIQVAEVHEFPAGEYVMKMGDRGDQLFIVLDGLVQIMHGDQILSEVSPGEHFGEMALIRAAPRSASARAAENSELISLRRADFFEILRSEQELAVRLLWQFLGVLADRLDQTSRDLSTAKEELLAEDVTSDVLDEDAAATKAAAATESAGAQPATRASTNDGADAATDALAHAETVDDAAGRPSAGVGDGGAPPPA